MSYPINYPTPQNADVQIFSQGGSTSTWVKPQGCSFVYFFLLGAGGNGAGGTTSAAGGGGGASGTYKLLIPAFLIPDQLRVQVGLGGGGNASTNDTKITYQQKNGTGYDLIGMTTGGNASGTSAGGAGTEIGPSTPFRIAGFAIGANGASGAAAGAAVSSQNISCGGAGGATTTTGTGSIVSNILYGYPAVSGGSGTTGGNGSDGISVTSGIMYFTGGAGGGGSTTGSGGNGGNGGIGSGGGGGGICTTGTSNGGRGGDGLVVIISW